MNQVIFQHLQIFCLDESVSLEGFIARLRMINSSRAPFHLKRGSETLAFQENIHKPFIFTFKVSRHSFTSYTVFTHFLLEVKRLNARLSSRVIPKTSKKDNKKEEDSCKKVQILMNR